MTRNAVILLCLVGAMLAQDQSSLRSAVSRGDAAMKKGRFVEANRSYDEAIGVADPDDSERLADLFFRKAHAMRGAGELLVALEAIEIARSYQQGSAIEALYGDLQRQASGLVHRSDRIVEALRGQTARGFSVSGDNSIALWVGFAVNSAELSQQGARQASQMAMAMLHPEFEGHRFLLVGHTDVRGSAAYNQDLSSRRASRLRQWLIERFEFNEETLEAEGRGEKEPVAEGDTDWDHARNRRVELKLVSAR